MSSGWQFLVVEWGWHHRLSWQGWGRARDWYIPSYLGGVIAVGRVGGLVQLIGIGHGLA